MAMMLEGPRLGGYKSTFTMDNLDGENHRKKGDGAMEEDGSITGLPSRPVSALARGVQITEFAESRVNPTPLLLEESDILLEQYLSPGKLQLLTGVDDLESVESLELKVDSRETSLGNFGSLLPNLVELKLSGSNISCVRDLGSSLRRLRVLWLTRCGLEELDGISSMLNLAELYLEYNEISDLSPLSMLEHLEILDLEGNNIDDVTQIQYLSLCPRLRRLALDGNPICVTPSVDHEESGYDYRQTIKKMLPNLLVLDDERLDEAPSSLSKHNVFDDDWAYLEELQKDALLQGEFEQEEGAAVAPHDPGERPTTAALRPATSYRPGSSLRPSSGFRPLSASRRPSTMSGPNTPSKPGTPSLRPVSSDAVEGLEITSDLTIGGVICGNPSKALRQRRQGGPGSKEEIQKGLNKLMQKGAVFTHSEDSKDVPLKAEDEMNNIIEELQSWKVEHEKRMEVIKKSKEAQVLVVDHDEAEDLDISGSDVDSDLEQSRDDYRPPSSQQRHSADLRLKANKGKPPQLSTKPRTSVDDSPSPRSPRVDSPRTKRPFGVKPSESFSVVDSGFRDEFGEDRDFEHGDRYGRPSSVASLSSYQRPLSREGGFGDSKLDWNSGGEHRPRSRGQGEPSLAPLRAPSPTSAQIISSLRQRHQDLTPTSARSKKLRIGPTGLPSSSQQPVIKNSLIPPPSRSGLVPGAGPRTPTRSTVPLLPSQPRIPRQLPETPSLLSQPPNKS